MCGRMYLYGDRRPQGKLNLVAYSNNYSIFFRCKWDFWFRVLDPQFTQIDDRWVRRVKLSLMLKILRADPMAYLVS